MRALSSSCMLLCVFVQGASQLWYHPDWWPRRLSTTMVASQICLLLPAWWHSQPSGTRSCLSAGTTGTASRSSMVVQCALLHAASCPDNLLSTCTCPYSTTSCRPCSYISVFLFGLLLFPTSLLASLPFALVVHNHLAAAIAHLAVLLPPPSQPRCRC